MPLPDRISDLGRSLISTMDEIRRVPCPRCGNQNLSPIYVEQHVIIKCHAPISMAGDTESEIDVTMCSYSQVIYQTSVTDGPFQLKFREPIDAPVKVVRKPTRKRPAR